ncbi:HAD family hydrolase [Ascidiimonas aurantiaca]|uniref:HAD family hydrolase n=1 Tax=Ascidiimonas aurantiaca TaxID=1685432 RepID=UPI0030EE1BB9
MKLANVQLVVTDMDGTLLNSKGEVSTRFFELFEELSSYGVHFVAASGRQYQSILSKLDLIKDKLIVIAENGGIAMQGDHQLLINTLRPDELSNFIDPLRNITHTHLILCGKKGAYIENPTEEFIPILHKYYYSVTIVNDLKKVTDDVFLKLACYHMHNSEQHLYPSLKKFKGLYQIKVSDEKWLDISHLNAHKGNALKQVQQELGISPEQTMVFGDYNNDIEMLRQGYFSYAMKNAHPNVIKTARFQTQSNDKFGVEIILESVLRAKKGI